MRKTIPLTKVLVLVTFIFGMLLILPNDYKHLVPNGGVILNSCALIFLFLSYFINFPRIVKFIKKNLLFALPFFIIILATLLNNGEVPIALYNIVYLLFFYFIGAFFGEYKLKFIKIAEIISFIILCINVLVTIFYGQPLSYSATAGRIFFIFEGSMVKLMACNILLFFIGKKLKITNFAFLHYVVYALSFYCITFSSTGFYSLLFMFVFMFFVSKSRKIGNVLKLISFYIVALFVVDILVIFDLLSPILSDIFNKSITLSGRTEIWGSAIEIIKDHPWIGIGEFSSDYFIELTGVNGATHSHNQILQILLNSGLIGFVVYFYYAFKLVNLRKYVKNNLIVAYYLVYLSTIIIMCVTSLPFDNFFYLSVLIAVNYVGEKKIKNNRCVENEKYSRLERDDEISRYYEKAGG